MNNIIRNILRRLARLEKNSHPPVDWEKKIDKISMEKYEFMEIIKHLVQENKDLQKRLDILEEILHSYLPIVGEDNKKK